MLVPYPTFTVYSEPLACLPCPRTFHVDALWGRCRLPYPHSDSDAALQNTVNVGHLFVREAFASADYSECLLGTNACVALLPVLD